MGAAAQRDSGSERNLSGYPCQGVVGRDSVERFEPVSYGSNLVAVRLKDLDSQAFNGKI